MNFPSYGAGWMGVVSNQSGVHQIIIIVPVSVNFRGKWIKALILQLWPPRCPHKSVNFFFSPTKIKIPNKEKHGEKPILVLLHIIFPCYNEYTLARNQQFSPCPKLIYPNLCSMNVLSFLLKEKPTLSLS